MCGVVIGVVGVWEVRWEVLPGVVGGVVIGVTGVWRSLAEGRVVFYNV